MERVALIRYAAPDGQQSVASGLLVRENAVLTARHVADGSGHWVHCANRRFQVEAVVMSPITDVDLAVLVLRGRADGITPLAFARVDRTRTDRIGGCVAVGFPRWNVDSKRRRVSAQVNGHVPSGDGLDPTAMAGADGELLTLVCGWNPTGSGSPPRVPEGMLTPGSPWGGMSGAVVVAEGTPIGDVIIGVIRSHNSAKGGQALTVTPLTALKRLEDEEQQAFCLALGLETFGDLPVLPGVGAGKRPKPEAAGSTGPFGAGHRSLTPALFEQYLRILVEAGLPVPHEWSSAELHRLRRDYLERAAGPAPAGDLLEALCTAMEAMPVFKEVGGSGVSIRKLQYIYRRTVGRAPESGRAEEMLIEAASAGIAEQRLSGSDRAFLTEPLTALARFMLGVAAHCRPAGDTTVDDPGLHVLIRWVADSLGHQQADAIAYLKSCAGRTWVLVELRAQESDPAVRAWPDQIIIDLIPKHGPAITYNLSFQASSEDDVRQALRDAIATLPDGEVCVDLLLPRQWLCAGIEHWPVVDIGGTYESMSRHLEPRLRWAMHSNNRWLRRRLEAHFGKVDWSSDPEVIPAIAMGDPDTFEAWVADRTDNGIRHPPFFAGYDAPAHDPLGRLLREGHGCLVWFNQESATAEDAWQQVVHVSRGIPERDRRDCLPRVLAGELNGHRPVIIWSDPEGREDFDLPASRRGGTLRRGAR